MFSFNILFCDIQAKKKSLVIASSISRMENRSFSFIESDNSGQTNINSSRQEMDKIFSSVLAIVISILLLLLLLFFICLNQWSICVCSWCWMMVVKTMFCYDTYIMNDETISQFLLSLKNIHYHAPIRMSFISLKTCSLMWWVWILIFNYINLLKMKFFFFFFLMV